MGNKFKGQRSWIWEILNKYDEVEKLQPKLVQDIGADKPDWVNNLMLIILGVSHPGLKVKSVKKWKARDLGRLLGRQYALEHLMWGDVSLSPAVAAEAEQGMASLAALAKKKHPEIDLEKTAKALEPEMRKWRPLFKKFMQEALASACERPHVETVAFFEAFGKAIVIKPDDLLTERTMSVGDKLCWTMLAMWQKIECLESVAQLHRILEMALKPHGIVLRYKRIEKLCQRIKLKFKDRGRPPGSKIQTNPPAV